ncbi:MAG: class I SAM-dependent methyltransferase [Polyangiaceae bacterium]|nr:class I SAM-dependent methyltransferase [Polyangiaceae bacterium]
MRERLDRDTLRAISRGTLRHYDDNAAAFEAGTRNHDVSQNVSALLRHIEGPAPFTLLDLGCGPGRDLRTFSELGHDAVGLEGSAAFVEMARAASGCEVLHQDFLTLGLPCGRFHGIFANASLFHVPTQELPRVLGQLHAALRPRGVLFTSNPRGQGEEGWQGDRYGAYHDIVAWRTYLSAAGYDELEHYYRPPGRPLHEQPWLATVWRKVG